MPLFRGAVGEDYQPLPFFDSILRREPKYPGLING